VLFETAPLVVFAPVVLVGKRNQKIKLIKPKFFMQFASVCSKHKRLNHAPKVSASSQQLQ
jgi:hypothetical protein